MVRTRKNMTKKVPAMPTIIARASDPEQERLHDKAEIPANRFRAIKTDRMISKILLVFDVSLLCFIVFI